MRDKSCRVGSSLELIRLHFTVNQLIAENHDLQVRFRWGKNDLAIWDKYAIPHDPPGFLQVFEEM